MFNNFNINGELTFRLYVGSDIFTLAMVLVCHFFVPYGLGDMGNNYPQRFIAL